MVFIEMPLTKGNSMPSEHIDARKELDQFPSYRSHF